MVRIAGVNIPSNKKIGISLCYVHGIGLSSAKKILSNVEVDFNSRVSSLSDDDFSRIRSEVERSYIVEGDLRDRIAINIKRKKDSGRYDGLRHRRGLPVRGQRTHTNARTRKGKKKMAVVGKKK